MKPEPTARCSHPDTTNPRWLAGKQVFADLIKGGSTGLLGMDDLKDALFYSKNLLTPPAGGVKVRLALRAEAKKRGVLP